MTVTRRRRWAARLLVGAPLATSSAVWLGCDDADCVRSLYTITEQRATPAGIVCGDVVSNPTLPATCLPSVCTATCPQLRLTDGTAIPPSRCTQVAPVDTATGGAGGSGGSGGGPAAGGTIVCEYDLDVDSCSSRQAARGE